MTFSVVNTLQTFSSLRTIMVIISCFCLVFPELSGQSTFVNENQNDQALINRLFLLDHISAPNLSVKQQASEFIFMNPLDSSKLSPIDAYRWKMLDNYYPEVAYLNDEKLPKKRDSSGFFRHFYKTPYSFLTVQSDDFFFHVKPILQIGLGDDRKDDNLIFQNTRGISINGIIDKKVYFKTTILENQQRFYNYFENEIARINAIPGQGFFRPYQSGIIDAVNGWDFLNASGYAGLRISKSIDLRIGHGRNFIGNGLRSMLLSDYGNNYFFLQLNTRVWKFHLQNTFTELSVNSSRDNQGNTLLPKKYMAYHYLDFQINENLSIGLFESVVFSREDHFEFQYLNPIILYRSVEQFLDSPDNVLLGLNMNWKVKKGWQIYGQLLLDELRTDQIFSGDGWWGNKVAYQVGTENSQFPWTRKS